jgi:hypothetical protein
MPGQLAFPNTFVGATSALQPLVITNNTAAAVLITSITPTGDFSVAGACPTIAAHATCTVNVSFAPSAVGSRAGGITVKALADSVPYTVTLSGNGVANPLPALHLSATVLGFGNVIYGGSPATQTVVLSNVGTAPLFLSGISESGNSDFSVSNNCAASMAAGAQCSLGVAFAPHAIGARSGTVTIRSNAAGSPHTINLSGTGCRYFSPAAARFFLTSC